MDAKLQLAFDIADRSRSTLVIADLDREAPARVFQLQCTYTERPRTRELLGGSAAYSLQGSETKQIEFNSEDKQSTRNRQGKAHNRSEAEREGLRVGGPA